MAHRITHFMGEIMDLKEKHEACEVKTKSTLYKIGVFAAMNHVTVKTLRFYEEQKLLLPSYINYENGYRYYELSQMADIHQISALKQAGFTLEEIASIRKNKIEQNDKTENITHSILLKKKSELLSKIAELTGKLSIVENYLSKNTKILSSPVLVKTVPAVTVAYMKVTLESYDCLFDLMPKMGALMEKSGCKCALPEYCFTNYLESGYKDENICVEICESVTEKKKETGGLKFKKMPEVQVACIFHKGSYKFFPESYEILLKYIEENGYKISGEIRESYIDGVWNKDDESQWLSEIQIPVEKV